MDLVERFINYTKFDTQSSEESTSVPSTAKQLEFAKYLKKELEDEGLSDVEMDDMGYIYATLKSNTKKKTPTIGFISHMDTSPDASGKDVKARVIKNYDGNDIELSPGIISSVETFPELKAHKGEDIIVTDGTTLLGADDKAGIAEIVQAMCYLRDHDEIKHGDIRVGFNPDEEIGMGAHHFDVEKFGCDWAYTVDGGDLGDLEYENFNAAGAKIIIKGVSVHTGYAKGKMVNASRLAVEFQNMIPENETPEQTEGYQGFYHLIGIESRCEEAKLSYIIRDHDRNRFENRKDFIEDCVNKMNEKYGDGTVKAVIYDQYYNMKEKIDPNMHVIDIVLSGGRFVDIIESTTYRMWAKYDTNRQIEVAVSAKRLEQKTMNYIPIFLLAFLKLSSRDYMSALYGNLIGVIFMSTCLLAYAGAIKLAKKFLQVGIGI